MPDMATTRVQTSSMIQKYNYNIQILFCIQLLLDYAHTRAYRFNDYVFDYKTNKKITCTPRAILLYSKIIIAFFARQST